ncbi:hypothetical protein LQ356_01815 [Metamycoplasma faucium]|uniref:DUF16 domain-containing protein n=1 Tax=Metamycoplasma faucium TaxID=56142 RepID=A0ABZ2TKH1_9BACT
MKKIKSIILQNEIDPKTGLVLIKDYNSYNSIKFYLQKDEETPNIKYVIYMFDENSKIVKEAKGKSMKQSEFQQYVIEQFKEQKKFNEQQLKFNEKIWNRLDSIDNRLTLVENRLTSVEKRLDSVENRLNLVEKRLDSVENRLTRLESFHEKDIKKHD